MLSTYDAKKMQYITSNYWNAPLTPTINRQLPALESLANACTLNSQSTKYNSPSQQVYQKPTMSYYSPAAQAKH